MSRLAALLPGLITATVAALGAAPPLLKPTKSAGPWFDGWASPVDPVGNCKFERDNDRLIIRVPGRGHEFSFSQGRLNAPRLLRDIEGDFAMQVRVGGGFRPTSDRISDAHRAGIVVLFGKNGATLFRGASMSDGKLCNYLEGGFFKPAATRAESFLDPVTPLGRTVYLRVERRGNTMELKISPNGKRWTTKLRSDRLLFLLPDKLKVGVVAESTAEGILRAEFDQLQLTPLGRPTRGKSR